MKKLLVIIVIATISSTSLAQYVSLDNQEIIKLQELISTDKEVKTLYQHYERLANSFLAAKPNPIEKITSAGKLQGDPEKVKTIAALKDIKAMYALALCYRITSEKKYLNKAVELLTAWASVNKPSSSPIDHTNLEPAIEAYDLVKSFLNKTQRRSICGWFRSIGKAERYNIKLLPFLGTGKNNWNSHRLKIVGEIAYTIEDKELQEWVVEKLKSHLAVNLNADGTSYDFKSRDAIHYHVYDLEPLVRLSILLHRATGKDYYHHSSIEKSSISKSVNWLKPYLDGSKTHKEFLNTTVKFDIDRSKNKEAGHVIGEDFKPQKALRLLALANYFDKQSSALISLIKSASSKFTNWQMVLNNVMQK